MLLSHQKRNAETYGNGAKLRRLDSCNAEHRVWKRLQLEILVNTTERLRQSVAKNDIKELLDVLQICTRNNVGGIMNEELFNKTHLGEPRVEVNDFIDAVVAAIDLRDVSHVKRKAQSTKSNRFKRVYKISGLLKSGGETAWP